MLHCGAVDTPAWGSGTALVGSPRGIAPPRTGWPEAVTRLRLPRNVACGFPALRSSEVGSQHSDSLQLPVWEIELWSQQRKLRRDPLKRAPFNGALPAPAAKHLVPVALHGSVHPVQRSEISGDTKVGVVSAEYEIEVSHLLLHR